MNVPHAPSHGCWSKKMWFSACHEHAQKSRFKLENHGSYNSMFRAELLFYRQILMLQTAIEFMCKSAILFCTAQGVVKNAEQDDLHRMLWLHVADERLLWYVCPTIWQTALSGEWHHLDTLSKMQGRNIRSWRCYEAELRLDEGAIIVAWMSLSSGWLSMGGIFWRVQWQAHVCMMNVKRWWCWLVFIVALGTWRNVCNHDWSWVFVAHVGSLCHLKPAFDNMSSALKTMYIVVTKDKSIVSANIALDAVNLVRCSLSFWQRTNEYILVP